MATLRTMNRRRRMRTNPAYVMGVYSTGPDGQMKFGFEKAICGRWQRFMPRGQSGEIAAYNAKLGKIEISDEELAAFMADLEGEPSEQDIRDFTAHAMMEALAADPEMAEASERIVGMVEDLGID